MVEGFAYALSEGLFVALGSIWALLFFRSVSFGRPRGLVASGLVIVLATLTRFHGVALLAAGGLWIAHRWPAGPRQRWKLGLSYGLVGAAPLLLWVLSRQAEGGTGTNREVGWRPIGLDAWNQLVDAIVEWVLPARLPYALGVIVTVALVWSALIRHPHAVRDEESFLLVLATAYLVFTVASRLLLDEAIPFDSRILLPIYPIALALIVLRITTPVDCVDARKVPALLLRLITAMGLGVAVLMPIRLASWAVQNEDDGLQYAAPEWQQSSLAHGLRALPSGTEVFSNSPPVVYLISNRVSLLGFGEGGLSNELEEALTEASTDVAVAVISSKPDSEVLEDRLSAAGWQRVGDDVASLWTPEEIRR